MPGLDLPGVYALHTMDDSFRIREHLDSENVREAGLSAAGTSVSRWLMRSHIGVFT
jgi:hypothetical protein